jgi:hypothetical protein
MAAAKPLHFGPDSPDRPRAPRDLRTPTARLQALGVDGEIVLSTSSVDELVAYLDATEPCASST